MSYQQYRPSGFSILPPVVKNLLIINGLFFLATITLTQFDLVEMLGLHPFESQLFKPYQLVTHFFMHGGLMHIFSNMLALWMFGNALENYWGGKRFLIYYLFTGLGSAALHLGILEFQIHSLLSEISPENIEIVLRDGAGVLKGFQNYTDPQMAKLNMLLNTSTVGASGAVFGVLLAFGMMYPNTIIYVYFALPIKAKYFVMLYGAWELYSGIQNNPSDNVAHFAHLGGMLFGYFLIRYWNKNRHSF
jgi:membrane associated rhomboid family serine protease